MNLELKYLNKCSLPSDINEHLPTLMRYAEECDHVTEMGVRWVVSTYAFMMGRPKRMISYDIEPVENHGISREELKTLALQADCDYDFYVADTRDLTIEETDLLFIDTLHTYHQLKRELELHANKSRKYIIFHDTTTFEFMGEGGREEGLWKAIEEFLHHDGNWAIHERYTNNNGLTILKRI